MLALSTTFLSDLFVSLAKSQTLSSLLSLGHTISNKTLIIVINAMKSSGRAQFSSSSVSSTSTVTYTFLNEHSNNPKSQSKTTSEIPIRSPSDDPSLAPTPIAVHLPIKTPEDSAARRIQSAYRSYIVRALVKKISTVNSETSYWERLIQRQETVDAVRASERERIKINEALMSLLFTLDSVPGVDPTVRELRRHVSHRIVGLQEILDAVCDARVDKWDGFLRDWDDVVEKIEKEVCEQRGGGHELERFCAEHLGFSCLQRFLRDY